MIAKNSVGLHVCLLLMALASVAGCSGGGEKGSPTSGTLLLDDMPLTSANVYYYPAEGTPSMGGGGTSDAAGKFTIQGARGSGLAPGAYKITVSKFLRADGSAPDPNVPPIESDAKETLPEVYSSPDSTPLQATVASGPTSHELRVQSKSDSAPRR